MTSRDHMARQWAEYYLNNWPDIEVNGKPSELLEKAKAAVKFILANTEPEPEPETMADVKWDAEKHTLAGATLDTDNGQVDVVMLSKDVSIIDYATLDGKHGYEHLSYFTPNGKRYRLVEVGATVSSDENVGPDQPEHPQVLFTMDDYENAPAGTVVAKPESFAWSKSYAGEWRNGRTWRTNREMADMERQVLRRGWGE